MSPESYCQEKAAKSGSSFYYAFRFLSKERRLAMTALYAFCREIDDVVDELHDENVARTKLHWWRDEIRRTFDNQATHPVTRALQPWLKPFDLPLEWFEEIIDGMQMDLDIVRYATFADLLLYCHRAAGVVGQLSAQIFGYQDRKTIKYAHELGVAFQLTNIIRDVGEDIRRGRLYLPVEDLEQFNVPATDIMHYRETPEFAALMDFQIQRAEQYYQKAWSLLPAQDRAAQKTGLVMAAIYRAILQEIKLDGSAKVLNQKLSLTPIRKLYLAAKTWYCGYRP